MGDKGAITTGRCVILAGGPTAQCTQPPEVSPADFVIACDAGYRLAHLHHLRVDLAVGDFDSLDEPPDPDVPTLIASPQKDDTDTLLGLREGLARGWREFVIYGGFGGRLDHTLANLQALTFLCDAGARGEIRADDNRAWVVRDGELILSRLDGWYLSVFAWGGTASGVTLAGVVYPLQGAALSPAFPLGVSNAFAAPTARIAVRDGTLLVIASQERQK